MLIFDAFPSVKIAREFAERVGRAFTLQTYVCETREQFDEVDVFPYELQLPIVAVERTFTFVEERIIDCAHNHGAQFAGT